MRKLERPAETNQHVQWIDVDLGEQAVARREAQEREQAAQLQAQSAAILQVAPAMPTPLGNQRAPQVLPSPLLR